MDWWQRLGERRRAERQRERERERERDMTPAQMLWTGCALIAVSAAYWGVLAVSAPTGSVDPASRIAFLFLILPVLGLGLLIAGVISHLRPRRRR